MPIKIAEISCGTEWSGVQDELEKAADLVGAKLITPEMDLDYIKEAVNEFGLEVSSPNLKLAIARALAVGRGDSDADAVFIVSCFRCAEGMIVRHALRKYIETTGLPVIMYSITEMPKMGELLIRMEALTTVVERKALLARERQQGLTLGIDSGSSTTKAVIMKDNEIIGKYWDRTTDVVKSAIHIRDKVLADIGINLNDIQGIGITGYGRFILGKELKAQLIQEELTVVSKGAVYLADKQKGEATVVDIGGLDNKVITLLNGIPDAFTVGGLCAGASGRFLELAARRLGKEILEFGELATRGKASMVKMDSYCSIFGIQDLVSALAEGSTEANVAAAACNSVAEQVFEQQLKEIDLREPIIEVGGTSLIKGLVKQMKAVLGREIIVPPHSQFCGAVGAAVLVSGLL
ncbi:MAG: methanogenesis marker 15 protein [Candidatus Helarchaeota archaeon]